MQAASFRTPLTELLDVRHPVLLAPMARVSGGALAAAVSKAGGLGFIGGGYGEQGWLEAEFGAAGDERVGVGFITWSLARKPRLLDWTLEHAPAAVMLSFGALQPFADKVRAAGVPLVCQVQSVAAAREAVQCGADLIVAQGTEAGGHGAHRAALALVPAVVDAVAPIPVAAAGGISDGRGLAAALVLGAGGALLGTRFYAAQESLGHARAKQRIVEASGDDTLRTRVFDMVRGIDWPAAYTGRAINNAFSDRWHGNEAGLQRDAARQANLYQSAVEAGNFDEAAVLTGEGLDLIAAIEPAGDLVTRIVAEAKAALQVGA